jgi:hypothetical protein
MPSAIVELIAVIACLITFFVARKVLTENLKIGPPNILATCLSVLAFLGFHQKGQELVETITFPFIVLVTTLLLLFLLVVLYRYIIIPLEKWRYHKRLISDERVKQMHGKSAQENNLYDSGNDVGH